MDAGRFDALSRSLTTAGSRRRALTGLLLGSIGVLRARAGETAAKNCKKIKDKKRRKRCQAKAKDPMVLTPSCTPNCFDRVCGPDGCGGSCGECLVGRRVCNRGACECPAERPVVCNGECVSLATDARHCGSCGAGCGFNEQCVNSVCMCGTITCTTLNTCCGSNACTCSGASFITTTCQAVMTCPEGTASCTGTTGVCGTGMFPARACCPDGTRCDDGKCRYM